MSIRKATTTGHRNGEMLSHFVRSGRFPFDSQNFPALKSKSQAELATSQRLDGKFCDFKMKISIFVLVVSAVFIVSCTTIDGQIIPKTSSFVKDSGSISAHFCPTERCDLLFKEFLSEAEESLHCAFYDFTLTNITDVLNRPHIETKLVIDVDNKKKASNISASLVFDSGQGLMHDKFCIIDGKRVFTGSMNPTMNDAMKNDNNLLFIDSEVIAGYYESEFAELWSQSRNGGSTSSPVLINGTKIEVYFCPEDECADKVVRELRKAKETVNFMTFSFTHKGIANALLVRMDDGVAIRGVYEKRQLSGDSTMGVLEYQDAYVRIDGNKYTMHHKVFIIDGETVITGSFNPSKNADERNDENLLIIRDRSLAAQFEKEFERVFGMAQNDT